MKVLTNAENVLISILWVDVDFYFFSCLALASIFCCGEKKQKNISELLFVSPLSERERRLMNGKDIFSPFSLTACRHLAASAPLATACGRSNSPPSILRLSTSGRMAGRQHGQRVLLCSSARKTSKQTSWTRGRGATFHCLFFSFLFFLRESFGRALVRARASRNVGHSCRVMSALRSWHCCLPLSGGTCCSAGETSANSRGERREAVGCFVSPGVKTPHTPSNSLYISDPT